MSPSEQTLSPLFVRRVQDPAFIRPITQVDIWLCCGYAICEERERITSTFSVGDEK